MTSVVAIFVGYGIFKQIVLLFVGYGASRVKKKSVCFLGEENIRHSVDFLFGRKSHGAYNAAYQAPTTPETNHEHDVESDGPKGAIMQTIVCSKLPTL